MFDDCFQIKLKSNIMKTNYLSFLGTTSLSPSSHSQIIHRADAGRFDGLVVYQSTKAEHDQAPAGHGSIICLKKKQTGKDQRLISS